MVFFEILIRQLCDDDLELVSKVECCRRAILENLHVTFVRVMPHDHPHPLHPLHPSSPPSPPQQQRGARSGRAGEGGDSSGGYTQQFQSTAPRQQQQLPLHARLWRPGKAWGAMRGRRFKTYRSYCTAPPPNTLFPSSLFTPAQVSMSLQQSRGWSDEDLAMLFTYFIIRKWSLGDSFIFYNLYIY